MKKTLLALIIPSLLLTGTSQAVELYNDQTNSVNMIGWLGFTALNDGHETSVIDNFSRVGFRFDRQEKKWLELLCPYGMGYQYGDQR